MKKDKGFEIKGKNINMAITLTILVMLVVGAFSTTVADNLEKLATLIIGFFTVSYGVWQTKKYFEEKEK